MIFTKEDDSTGDEQVEFYKACVGSLIYIRSKTLYLCFAVHHLEKFYQMLVNYTLKGWHNCWYVLRTTRMLDWYIFPIYRIHLYLPPWDRLVLIPRTNSWWSLISSGSNVQIMEEIQEHILCFIKVEQLIISHMFQFQFPNIVLKVSTMQHAL